MLRAFTILRRVTTSWQGGDGFDCWRLPGCLDFIGALMVLEDDNKALQPGHVCINVLVIIYAHIGELARDGRAMHAGQYLRDVVSILWLLQS